MKNIEIIWATKFISPMYMKNNAIAQVRYMLFIGSLSFFLPFAIQRSSFREGNTWSLPRAWRVLGAIIIDPSAEDIAAHASPIGIIGPQIAISLITSWLLAKFSRLDETVSLKATKTYIIAPKIVAAKVPLGIDFLGFFKSPERPKPAEIPVNAGKIIVKT